VVGHDTAAAAAMGQLRGLLRGIAHHSGAGPAEILRGLDEAMLDMHTDTLATAAVARLSADCGARTVGLCWANAGHPPPMLVSPDGGVVVLGGPIGDLMLGVDPTAERAEPVLDLSPSTTLLLYTDGLIERRERSLQEGLDLLIHAASTADSYDPEGLLDHVLRAFGAPNPNDDTCVVAIQIE
jgi:serine phosphatase RsbU (regulator of sigma subunit)